MDSSINKIFLLTDGKITHWRNLFLSVLFLRSNLTMTEEKIIGF